MKERRPSFGARRAATRGSGRFLPSLALSAVFHVALVATFSFGGLWAVRAGRGERARSAGLEVEPPVVEDLGDEEAAPAEPLVWAEAELDVEPAGAGLDLRFLELPEPPSQEEPDVGPAPDPRLAEPSPESWGVSIRRSEAGAASLESGPPAASEASSARAPEPEAAPEPLASPPASPTSIGARLLESPSPRYPSASIRAREEGTVLCRLHITAEGAVSEVEIVESSGHARLDQAAREALSSWRFAPRVEGGRPVGTTLLHPVEFVLTGD